MKGSIYKYSVKNKNINKTKYRAQIDLPGDNRKRKTKSFDTHGAAEEWLTKRNYELYNGELTENNKELILKVFVENIYYSHAKDALRPKTINDYRKIMDTHIIPKLGHRKIRTLTTGGIEYFLNKTKNNRQDGKKGPLCTSTVRKIFNVLRSVLTLAEKYEIIVKNPAVKVEVPSAKRSKDISPMTAEQVSRFLKVADHSCYGPIYSLTLHTGLRLGEITGLRWGNVDFEEQKIFVKESLSFIGGEPVFGDPKTHKSRRSIKFDSEIKNKLLEHQKKQEELKHKSKGEWQNKENLVFCSTTGTPIGHRNILRQMQRFLEKADLPHYTFHNLRDTYATLLSEDGINAKGIRDLLGHQSIEITNKYLHGSEKDQEKAAQSIGNSIRGAC